MNLNQKINDFNTAVEAVNDDELTLEQIVYGYPSSDDNLDLLVEGVERLQCFASVVNEAIDLLRAKIETIKAASR